MGGIGDFGRPRSERAHAESCARFRRGEAMRPSDVISPAATRPANGSQAIAPGVIRTTYVFIFVPVYIGRKSDAKVRSASRGPLREATARLFNTRSTSSAVLDLVHRQSASPIAEMKQRFNRIYIVITLLTGIVYALAMTGVVQILFLLDQVQQP